MAVELKKEEMFVSAVIYARDQIPETAEFVKFIAGVFDGNFKNYEIIVSDDGSLGDVREVLSEFAGTVNGSVSVVRMSYPQGRQLALNAGVDMAIGDYVFEFESVALDFDGALIMEAFGRELEGYDIVSAVPKGAGTFSSRLFYRVFNMGANGRYPLLRERFRVVSRRAVNRVEAMSDLLVYRKAFYRNSGLKCSEVTFTPTGPQAGDSLPEERGKLAADSIILFTSLAYKLSLFLTVAMMFFAAVSGIYTAAVFLAGKPAEGWTTMMMFMSFAFFGVFAILTVAVKYLSLLVELSFKKSRYISEGVYKLN